MFSHVMLGSNDIQASKVFYDKVLGVLGISEGGFETKHGLNRVVYWHKGGVFLVTEP